MVIMGHGDGCEMFNFVLWMPLGNEVSEWRILHNCFFFGKKDYRVTFENSHLHHHHHHHHHHLDDDDDDDKGKWQLSNIVTIV